MSSNLFMRIRRRCRAGGGGELQPDRCQQQVPPAEPAHRLDGRADEARHERRRADARHAVRALHEPDRQRDRRRRGDVRPRLKRRHTQDDGHTDVQAELQRQAATVQRAESGGINNWC